MPKPVHDPLSKHLDRNSRIEVKNTTCYMCASRCGIRVTLRDGEVRYIQGNPDHPLNKGVICAKVSSGIIKRYSPARLTRPLLRKAGTDCGEHQFEEISWDKTFDMIEERLAATDSSLQLPLCQAKTAWGLDGDADESQRGFLLNHVISEELPPGEDGEHLSNSDPVTGQAGWYDVHVRIYPADSDEVDITSPRFDTLRAVPGQSQGKIHGRWLTYLCGKKLT